jgi:hypothetical protein
MNIRTKKNVRYFFIIALILFIVYGFMEFEKIMGWNFSTGIYNEMNRILFTNKEARQGPYAVMRKRGDLLLYSDTHQRVTNISSQYKWTQKWETLFKEKAIYGIVSFPKKIVVGAGNQSQLPGDFTLIYLNSSGKEVARKEGILPPGTFIEHMSSWENDEVVVFGRTIKEERVLKDIYIALYTSKGELEKETTISLTDYLNITHTMITSTNDLVFSAILSSMLGSIHRVHIITMNHELEVISHRKIEVKHCQYITGLCETDGEIVLTGGGLGNMAPCLYRIPLDELSNTEDNE